MGSVPHTQTVGSTPQAVGSTPPRLPAACPAVEPDEPHIAAVREANKAVKAALYNLGVRSPFL